MTLGAPAKNTGAPGLGSWSRTRSASTAAAFTTRLPESEAGAVPQPSVSERKPQGTPAAAQTRAASRLTASLPSGSTGQAIRLTSGRRRSSSAPPRTAAAISTSSRAGRSPTQVTAWKCFVVLASTAAASCRAREATGASPAATIGPQ